MSGRRAPMPASNGRSLSNRMRYSQNLLRDPAAVRLFISVLPPDGGHLAVEVGAGDGALTRALAEHFGEVKAYEIDGDMVRRLRQRGLPANVRLIHADFLRESAPTVTFHVAANIPFAITSKVIDWCLTAQTLETATLITELAYARKRTGDYGRWSKLTIATWPWFEWRLRGRIDRRCFKPAPTVDAGILTLERRPQPLVDDAHRRSWEQFVERGFTGIGGSLYRSLKPIFGRSCARAFADVGIPRDQIVAFVEPGSWLSLFQRLPDLDTR